MHRRSAALTVVGTVALLLSACASAGQPGDRGPGVVGACHALDRPEHLSTISDSAPPTRCTQRHTTQTFLISTVPSRFATEKVRPNAAERTIIGSETCDAGALREYLGASAHDGLFGMWTVAFLPTVSSWNDGARWVRCDVVESDKSTALDPVVRTASLAGAVAGHDGQALLLCYRQASQNGALSASARQVRCDARHTSRDVNDWTSTAIQPHADDYLALCIPPVAGAVDRAVAPADVSVVIVPDPSGSSWSVRCAAVEAR